MLPFQGSALNHYATPPCLKWAGEQCNLFGVKIKKRYSVVIMQKHLYVFLLLTFFMGFLGGMYLYFLTRSANDAPSASPSVSKKGYEIIATTYGGCERIGCASLRILDDGSYTYLVPGNDAEYSRYEDVLSDVQIEELTNFIENTSFDSIEMSKFQGTCPITYDGVAYRFEVTFEGKIYDLDSCVNDLGKIPLFDEFVRYFEVMHATYVSS